MLSPWLPPKMLAKCDGTCGQRDRERQGRAGEIRAAKPRSGDPDDRAGDAGGRDGRDKHEDRAAGPDAT